MKTNDWLLAASAIVFSILFYDQSSGLNYFLFTLLISALILFFNPGIRRDPKWWYYAILTHITGASVVLVNSDLSVFACITSVLVLSSKSFNKENSILVSYFFGVYSVLSSLIYWIIDLGSKQQDMQLEHNRKKRRSIGGILIGLVIAFVFFLLYRQANPLFKDLTKNINFDWLSFGWIFFTFWGFLVLLGLIKTKYIDVIGDTELKWKVSITNNDPEQNEINNKAIIAISTFVILNIMLLFLNGLDIVNIYITQKLPAGITLLDFVHQSVWSMIFSIIIAVTMIMWIFNGKLNFSAQGKYIKYLIYLWIFQSVIMIVNTMVRNYWYISSYQLSYLRIGVYVFLLLSVLGLVLTALKVAKQKSAWRLVSDNFEVWFLILAISTLFNWDTIITNYNIVHATSGKRLDKMYLLSLSDANMPQLIKLYEQENWETKFTDAEKLWFMQKVEHCSKIALTMNWQSFNLRSQENAKEIVKLKLK